APKPVERESRGLSLALMHRVSGSGRPLCARFKRERRRRIPPKTLAADFQMQILDWNALWVPDITLQGKFYASCGKLLGRPVDAGHPTSCKMIRCTSKPCIGKRCAKKLYILESFPWEFF